ncbi:MULTISPECIES: Hpt domain-containing protein [Alphaproteobacteria]|uniref:Transcriptional regulator n=2 Tax=Alphaproteobacteria TaxID=28211 RepID=A0A512HCH2_9HYPH|nr:MULTISPECIES: Hpt domain-containing protein [Alphaproteobacteria]GEO83147.1 transcriptional regulator [Ciceribacter naphthalenivorans]GLR20458.1 transcriptional regulator [Ciceribacter naphthalenivorans]GLT03314.1 transcriptional regulator [Sphingomonas psychrolutea]
MAALNIAFEAPENNVGRCPSQARPIDLVHLATKTKGDKAVELEILQIFARQARNCLQALASENDSAARIVIAGRLKNAADAVGAHTVQAAAEAVEREGPDAGRIAMVAARVIEVENFILKLCR